MEQKEIKIKNKKALFNYDILEKYTAGISLLGTEIKSIRNASVTLSSSFCVIEKNEIFKNKSLQDLRKVTSNINCQNFLYKKDAIYCWDGSKFKLYEN